MEMFNFFNKGKIKATKPEKVDSTLPNFSASPNGKSSSGVTVGEDQAMTLDAVFSCVNVLAQSIASLPLHLMVKEAKGGASHASENQLYTLLKLQPNSEMSSYEFRYWLLTDALLRGVGFAHILRDEDGNVLELWPLLASKVKPIRDDKGNLFFSYGDSFIPDSDILRVQVLPHGGVIGKSITALNASALGLAKASDDFAGEFFANGVSPSLIMNVDGSWTQEQFNRLKESLVAFQQGKGKRHNALVVEKDVSVTPMSINASEAQILESRKFSRSIIAGIFRVPPHLIGDLEKATFSSLEQQDLSFIKHTLTPWLTNIEQRLAISLLTPEEKKTHFFKFNLNALARGDMNSRFAAYSQAINAGIMTANECRALEDLPSYDGGDKHYIQGALRETELPYRDANPPVNNGENQNA